MKKSIFSALSASILLTGCLVKKSDYEAEQAAHQATGEELLKINEELVNTSAQLQAKNSALTQIESEVPALRKELEKSRLALAVAERAVAALKTESVTSSQRTAELASKVAAAEQKVAAAKELFTRRFQELKVKAQAEVSEVNARNQELRMYMLTNLSRADFYAKESGVVAPAGSAVKVAEVQNAPQPAADAPVVGDPAENSTTLAATQNQPKLRDLSLFYAALRNADAQRAAKEAMHVMSAARHEEAVPLAKEMIDAALATHNERLVEWVSAGIMNGTKDRKEVRALLAAQKAKPSDLNAFYAALEGSDAQSGFEESMRVMGRADRKATVSLVKKMTAAALATDNESVVNSVGLGIMNGAADKPSAAAAMLAAAQGTVYLEVVTDVVSNALPDMEIGELAVETASAKNSWWQFWGKKSEAATVVDTAPVAEKVAAPQAVTDPGMTSAEVGVENSSSENNGAAGMTVAEAAEGDDVKGSGLSAVDGEAAAAEKHSGVNRSWWNFWSKKSAKSPSVEQVQKASFDLSVYRDALNEMDEKAAAKEAMRMVGEQTDDVMITALSTQLMNAAVVNEDERILKWVSAAIYKAAGEQKDAAKTAILSSIEGTPYQASITQLLGL